MSDFDSTQLNRLTPLPMRTADEQWAVAGCECAIYATVADVQRDQISTLHFVSGKGGRCVMQPEEWKAYQVKCLQGAPQISMLVVESEEEARRVAGERLRPRDRILQSPHFHAWLLSSLLREQATAAKKDGMTKDEGLKTEDLRCIHSSLLTTLKEARDLVSSARSTLSVDDYGDALAGAFEKLSLSVGCLSALVEGGAR